MQEGSTEVHSFVPMWWGGGGGGNVIPSVCTKHKFSIIGERAVRAQCLVLSIEIFDTYNMYGRTFRKSMRGHNFTDVNGVHMLTVEQQLGNDEKVNRLLELRMRTWLAGVPLPGLFL